MPLSSWFNALMSLANMTMHNANARTNWKHTEICAELMFEENGSQQDMENKMSGHLFRSHL